MKEYSRRDNDFNREFNPKGIIYAGESSRRIAFLDVCFPNLPLKTIYPGEEPEVDDVGYIANFKLLKGLGQRNLQEGEIMIASDTRTKVPIVDKNGKINLISKGKPANLEQIYEYFTYLKWMIDAGQNPHY